MKRLLLPLALALAAVTCNAATNVVILGDNFQARIDAANAGDTLVVQAGVYPGALDFKKPLTIVRSGTNQLQFTGPATVTTTGQVTLSHVEFANTFSVVTNAKVKLHRATCIGTATFTGNASIEALDSTFAGFTARGGSVVIKRCKVNGTFDVNDTSVEALRMTNSSLTAVAPVGSGRRFVAAQCEMPIWLTGYSAWIGYNTIIPQASFTDCDVVFVGNKVRNPYISCGRGVTVVRGSLKFFNNLVYIEGQNNYCDRQFRGLILDSTVAEVANNSILISVGWVDNAGLGVIGIEAVGSTKATIRNSIACITTGYPGGSYFGITGTPEQLVSVSYCNVFHYNGFATTLFAGFTALNSMSVNPLFEPGYDLILSSSSPMINAGTPDAIRNDRDGSRNDIGYTGGSLWNPANYTNSNPIVFWLMPTNQTVLKGLQATIPINAAATAGH